MIRSFIYGGELVYPSVGAGSKIDESAQVIGDVRIGSNVLVLCCAVLRADEAWPFIIGNNVNIQDGVILHGLSGLRRTVGKIEVSVYVGEDVSLAHGSIIHGSTVIGRGSFVGFGSTLHNAVIGEKVYIGHMALVMNVTIGGFRYVPHGARITSQKAADKLPLVTDHDMRNFNSHVVQENHLLRQKYLALDIPKAQTP
ncbi:MAG: hypothetical protein Q8L09_05100 [Candidatus Moranbacteria bacterium]|nr:hypothetical protein [Candidatus Moranbacteria bacterium]